MIIKMPDGSVMDADTGAITPAGSVVAVPSKPTWDELAFRAPIPSVFNEIIETPKETVMDNHSFVVPKLGKGINGATVVKWLKEIGDSVLFDEPIIEMETDKLTVQIPSPVTGTLTEQRFGNGVIVMVGTVLGTVKETVMENVEKVLSLDPDTDSVVIKSVVAIPVDAITRDVDGWASALQLDKAIAYGLLRGLTQLNKCVTSPAPRKEGARGKPSVLYSLSPSVCAMLINQ